MPTFLLLSLSETPADYASQHHPDTEEPLLSTQPHAKYQPYAWERPQ